jgi:cytochrome c biogenesis protein
VPFRPQDAKLTSLGVVKVTNAAPKQVGLVGFLYPTVAKLTNGADTSIFPSLGDPLVTFNVWTGDLGLDGGAAQNVYELDTSRMTQVAGPRTAAKALELKPGRTVALPNGLGTVRLDSIARFAALDLHHDPSQGWVAGFALLIVAGLITSLLVPRRRMWLRVAGTGPDGLRLEYAALARGDDPALERALADFAADHRRELESGEDASARVPAGV